MQGKQEISHVPKMRRVSSVSGESVSEQSRELSSLSHIAGVSESGQVSFLDDAQAGRSTDGVSDVIQKPVSSRLPSLALARKMSVAIPDSDNENQGSNPDEQKEGLKSTKSQTRYNTAVDNFFVKPSDNSYGQKVIVAPDTRTKARKLEDDLIASVKAQEERDRQIVKDDFSKKFKDEQDRKAERQLKRDKKESVESDPEQKAEARLKLALEYAENAVMRSTLTDYITMMQEKNPEYLSKNELYVKACKEISLMKDVKAQKKGKGAWCFITVNPNSKVSFEDFEEAVQKCISKAWITTYFYSFEQRGEDTGPSMGRGFHAHILVNWADPARRMKEVKNTFKNICDYSNSHCLNFRVAQDPTNFINYIKGLKVDSSKMLKINVDKIWRKTMELDAYYSNEDSGELEFLDDGVPGMVVE